MPKRREDRGEAWVVGQVVLLLLAIVAPRWERRRPPIVQRMGKLMGVPAVLIGIVLIVPGLLQLGRNLTPLPKPKEHAVLVQHGVYGVVRHPLYSGLLFSLLGGALVTQRLSRLAVALAAFAFFDAKARREELWLIEKFPEYAAYRRKVRKLVPGLY
jgi:protein-S-isoprenylcysteine O-methyltransferase Ste14